MENQEIRLQDALLKSVERHLSRLLYKAIKGRITAGDYATTVRCCRNIKEMCADWHSLLTTPAGQDATEENVRSRAEEFAVELSKLLDLSAKYRFY